MPRKKSKNVSLRTAKKQAGKILANAINEIAVEKTELAIIDGEDVMISKVEALARLIWKSALGHSVMTVEGVTATEIVHPPSLAHQNILLDRIAGKVAASEPLKKAEKGKLADRIGEEAAKRINKINTLD